MASILLIEDDLQFAQIISECLEEDPEICVRAVIGDKMEARRQFEAGLLNEIDAVLIDLQLPISLGDPQIDLTGGLDLIQEMRVIHNYFGRVLVVTNSNSVFDASRAMRVGCDGYLCKHLRPNDLPALIAELRLAIKRDVMMLSSELRFVFMGDEYRGPTATR